MSGNTAAAKATTPPKAAWKATKTIEQWGPFVLFEGCIMSRRQMGSRYSTQFLLKKYGFDFQTMDDETCCGAPIMRSGREDVGTRLRRTNLDSVKKLGYRRVVSACAGCGSQLKSHEAEALGIGVFHMVELLYSLAKNGELVHPDMVDTLPKLTVTGHDPCHLGRGMGVDINTIHATIVNALPNQTWVECQEHDRCCGAGGGVRASQKDLSYAILQRKVKRLTRTGADIVLAACPFCELQIDEGLRKAEGCKMRAITPQAYIAMLFKDVFEEVDKL